jgi:hypothetical protein
MQALELLAMEFKDSVCALSQVMLLLEICEGQAAMAWKEFMGDGMKARTAMILGLF